MADARIAASFRTHPKRVKLQRRLGPIGVLAFIDLILFASDARTSGVLTGMTHEDIAIAAQWDGDAEQFVAALIDLRLLDRSEHGEISMHDWCEHNPFAANSDDRKRVAKINAHVGWLKRKGTTCQIKRCELCKSHTDALRSSARINAPSHHSLSPLPLTTHKEKKTTPSELKKKSATKTEVPEDFHPSDDLVARADRELGLSPAAVAAAVPKFILHHRAKGNTFKRVELAFWNWISGRFVPTQPALPLRTSKPPSAEVQALMNAKGKP